MTKYIFVTGGVVSGLGKGITAASLGRLLKMRGFKVAAQKLDPYININPGTMDPLEHGEVYVTDDGAETDLDLGHYERFIDEDLNKYSSLTTGKVYWNVLNKERSGVYGGKTVQIIPHITNEIKDFIYNVGKQSNADIVITEIGGTVGDIESQPYVEAIRQVARDVGRGNSLFIHVTLVPYISCSGEHKSKPTQHSVKELQSMGINPDIIIMRSDEEIDNSIRNKIALFCNVTPDCVIENLTVSSLYHAPVKLEESRFSEVVCRELNLTTKNFDMNEWSDLISRIDGRCKTLSVALVGKYVKLHDAYLSVSEALSHAGYETGAHIDINWVDSDIINEKNVGKLLSGIDAIVVADSFGTLLTEGRICAVKYARVNNIPFLGICTGAQAAVIDFARNVANIPDADSEEFDVNAKNKVVRFAFTGEENTRGGATRLGSYPCKIAAGTMLFDCYNKDFIAERHHLRYEINMEYEADLVSAGLVISGKSPDGNIIEVIENPSCDFFVGTQFHPEFKSRPNRAHPLFLGLIRAALKKSGK